MNREPSVSVLEPAFNTRQSCGSLISAHSPQDNLGMENFTEKSGFITQNLN